MRIAKIPSEVVYQRVWASLCERMDSETHLVLPEWKLLMRKVGVCRQRIADAVNSLKAEGKIEVVEKRVERHNRDWLVFYYRVKEG